MHSSNLHVVLVVAQGKSPCEAVDFGTWGPVNQRQHGRSACETNSCQIVKTAVSQPPEDHRLATNSNRKTTCASKKTTGTPFALKDQHIRVCQIQHIAELTDDDVQRPDDRSLINYCNDVFKSLHWRDVAINNLVRRE